MLSHISLRLCLFFFIIFSHCSSDCRVCIDLSSSSQILSSASSDLLLRPSSEFFSFHGLYFSTPEFLLVLFNNLHLFIDILYLIRQWHCTALYLFENDFLNFLNMFIIATVNSVYWNYLGPHKDSFCWLLFSPCVWSQFHVSFCLIIFFKLNILNNITAILDTNFSFPRMCLCCCLRVCLLVKSISSTLGSLQPHCGVVFEASL